MKPNGREWRELRTDLDLDHEVVADALGISVGHLKNVEYCQPKATVSDRLAKRAARYFGVPLSRLVITGGSGGVPDEPPQKEQEKETNTKPKPRKDPKGPKRSNGVAA